MISSSKIIIPTSVHHHTHKIINQDTMHLNFQTFQLLFETAIGTRSAAREQNGNEIRQKVDVSGLNSKLR